SFLAELNDFTYDTAIRNLDNNPLSDDELAAMEKYYEHAEVIKDELRKAQYMTLNNQVRWTDIELALLDGDPDTENDVLDGFRSIEDGTSNFAEEYIDNPFVIEDDTDNMYQMVKGKRHGEDDILRKAKDMFELEDETKMTISESLDGADIANYNVSYTDNDKEIFMDMTAFGAYPVSF